MTARAFSVTSLAEAEQADLAYRRARTPDERLEALELSRQIAPRPDCPRIFVKVAEFPPR